MKDRERTMSNQQHAQNAPKAWLFLILFAFGGLLMAGCDSYGENIVVNGTEIYFKGDGVTKADAEKLGKYLLDNEFADGNGKSVQLAKEEGVWQFRMVTLESFHDDADFANLAGEMAAEMSQVVFDSQSVEFHLCDDEFNTVKRIQAATQP